MDLLPKEYIDFVNQFKNLLGIGEKTASKMGLYFIKNPQLIANYVAILQRLGNNVSTCQICHFLLSDGKCPICDDTTRDQNVICIVEHTLDVCTIESLHIYHGLYHVLEGVISPLEGILPTDLTIPLLLNRIKKGNIREVIFAFGATTEGDMTLLYIKDLLKGMSLKLSSLGRGLSAGNQLSSVEESTLIHAFESRENLVSGN